MSEYTEDFEFTPQEKDLANSFFKLLSLDGKKVFTADDFFEYGLQRYLSDPAHMVGALFRKFKLHGLCVEAGHLRSTRDSNHGRELKLWKVVEEAKL